MRVFQTSRQTSKDLPKKQNPKTCVWKGDKQKAEKDLSITEALKVCE